jgi:hypothetical protein
LASDTNALLDGTRRLTDTKITIHVVKGPTVDARVLRVLVDYEFDAFNDFKLRAYKLCTPVEAYTPVPFIHALPFCTAIREAP